MKYIKRKDQVEYNIVSILNYLMAIRKKRLVWLGQLRAFIHSSVALPQVDLMNFRVEYVRPRSGRAIEDFSESLIFPRTFPSDIRHLTGVPWKRGTCTNFLPFFAGRETGVSRNLQAVSKVHFQILFT